MSDNYTTTIEPKSCPHCGSEHIQAGEIDPELLYRQVNCSDCGAKWEENFKFEGADNYCDPEGDEQPFPASHASPPAEPQDFIQKPWHVDDVLERRPDLSKEQCREVLSHMVNNHDAEIGINWDVIDSACELLFGEPPDTRKPYTEMTPKEAKRWLMEYDKEAAMFWRMRPLNADLIGAVGENLRDYGDDDQTEWRYVAPAA